MNTQTERAAHRLMVGFHGHRPSDELKRVLFETGARGVIVFARNLRDGAHARDLIADVRGLVPWPLLVSIDQEGGAVVRITKGLTVFPGNMALGAADDPELACAMGRASGDQLAALGVDLNLAPVVDLQTNPQNPGIGIRSLGSDRRRAEAMARGVVLGHRTAGVATCLKHFPGKGAAEVDAHIDLPVLASGIESFREPHVRIFEHLVLDVAPEAIMTSHIVVRGFDAARPATFSPVVVGEWLRRRCAFKGLIVADDLEMGAIARYHRVPDAAVAAAMAGHDIMPICHDWRRQLEAGRRLDDALGDGRLDRAENLMALARIEALCMRAREAKHPVRLPVPTSSGDEVAKRIAERAVHLFGDVRKNLPIAAEARLALLAAEPHAIVGVEEDMSRDWPALLKRLSVSAGLVPANVVTVPADVDGATIESKIDAVTEAGRVVFFSWNARGEEPMRRLLLRACERLGERLVVVHLRTPFDQVYVPRDVTALTPFGYRVAQLEAAFAVLSGRLEPRGLLPAPIA